MKLKVKKLNSNAIIPKYHSDGASGFDLHALDTISIGPGSIVKIKTGLSFEIPKGYELQIRPRSGLSSRTKLRLPNSPGTIDSDYRGEVIILAENISNSAVESVRIEKGDRIAQGVLQKIEQADIEVVDNLSETNRGSQGLGSTGE